MFIKNRGVSSGTGATNIAKAKSGRDKKIKTTISFKKLIICPLQQLLARKESFVKLKPKIQLPYQVVSYILTFDLRLNTEQSAQRVCPDCLVETVLCSDVM